jgi:hypothetical protein
MIAVMAAAEELFRASFFVSEPAIAGLAYAPDAIVGGAGCPTS